MFGLIKMEQTENTSDLSGSSLSFMNTDWTLLFQGAESRIYEGQYNSKLAILKERFIKKYRHPLLDKKLTKERIKSEIKAYTKIGQHYKDLSKQMSTILYNDDKNIIFTKITDSSTLSQYIIQCENEKKPELIEKILLELANLVAKIHRIDLIHGDLTTSNFLVNCNTETLVPIDFGLSYLSKKEEDRAVDLYVLERAIQSTHPGVSFEIFLKQYEKQMGNDNIIKKLDQVRMRGRKRLMIG